MWTGNGVFEIVAGLVGLADPISLSVTIFN